MKKTFMQSCSLVFSLLFSLNSLAHTCMDLSGEYVFESLKESCPKQGYPISIPNHFFELSIDSQNNGQFFDGSMVEVRQTGCDLVEVTVRHPDYQRSGIFKTIFDREKDEKDETLASFTFSASLDDKGLKRGMSKKWKCGLGIGIGCETHKSNRTFILDENNNLQLTYTFKEIGAGLPLPIYYSSQTTQCTLKRM